MVYKKHTYLEKETNKTSYVVNLIIFLMYTFCDPPGELLQSHPYFLITFLPYVGFLFFNLKCSEDTNVK